MVSSWEDKLIVDLKRAQTGGDADALRALDVLADGYQELTDAALAAVLRISTGAGMDVDARPGEDRTRWTFGTRALSIRLDREGGKVFLNADLGNDLAVEELSVVAGQLLDSRGQAADVAVITERFVTFLFRGGPS